MLPEECLRVRLADDVAEEGGDRVTPVALGRQSGIRRLRPREHPVDAGACCSRVHACVMELSIRLVTLLN